MVRGRWPRRQAPQAVRAPSPSTSHTTLFSLRLAAELREQLPELRPAFRAFQLPVVSSLLGRIALLKGFPERFYGFRGMVGGNLDLGLVVNGLDRPSLPSPIAKYMTTDSSVW